jgi:dTDP-glucose 4,6-dehydratase
MTTLITGGSGFVGLNLAEELLARGDSVVLFGLSPLPPGTRALLGTNEKRLAVVEGDVLSSASLDSVFRDFPITRVVHAAAVTADVVREQRAARSIAEVNVIGCIEVLEAALRHRLPRVLQLGTGSIFGAGGLLSPELDERTSPVWPETLYGITKFAAERIALRYRSTRALGVTVVRLGMVFGRWEYDTGVRDTLSLPLQLTRLAEQGARVKVHADCADDWVYSRDVAHGLALLLETPECPAEPVYHLSAGRRWSVADWCERLASRFPGFAVEWVDDANSATVGRGKVARRSPMRINRLSRDTGYTPQYLHPAAFEDWMVWRQAAREAGWPGL